MKKSALLLVAVTMFLGTFAQENKYGETPEIQEKCKQNISLYREFRDQKNVTDAFGPWRKAVALCPQAAKTLYIDGVNFYEEKIEKATDAAEKEMLIDSMLVVFDWRIEHFNQEGYVLGLKGMNQYKYRSDKPLAAYQTLKKSVELEKEGSQPGVLDIYYRTMFEAFKKGEIEREELLTEYLTITEYLDAGRAKTKEKYYQFYDKAKDNINEFFILVAQCEDIEALAIKKFEQAPNDADNIKKLAKIMTKRECTESDIFVKVAKKLNDIEPSHESSYTLGVALLKKSRYSEAMDYFKKAIDLSPKDNPELENYYLAAASTAIGIGQYSNANNYARKALAENPNSGKAYLVIGDAIAASAGSCGSNEFEQAAVYWLAVDYFAKAKSVDGSVSGAANSKIGSYSSRFPDKKMMFQYGYVDNAGNAKKEAVKIGCWINQEVMP
ncbi:MAG: tetratricopeptide repeat protein, partial [Luteibaculum sp.]